MKIFVTGGHGFLGQFLVKKLISLGHLVDYPSSTQLDLCHPVENNKINKKYDRIFHLAAWTQAGDFCLHHPGEQWIINQKINTNILDWWVTHQPQAKFISMGTSCSYDPELPLVEENYLQGKPIESLFTYAMTKRMLQSGIMALSNQYDLNYLTVIPSTLYGPNYHQDGRQMHFIFDLIRKILNGKFSGSKVELWGDGNQRRELVLVDDFVDALIELDSKITNQIINIGSGEDYSIKQFAEKICSKVKYDSDLIAYDTNRYVGARSKVLDNHKLIKILPKFQFTNLEDGLDLTINWFKNNFE